MNNEDNIEREQLIKEIVSLHFVGENPDFEEQVREVVSKYVIFSKNRLPYEETHR